VRPDAEKRAIKRISMCIVPFIVLLYFVSFLDRVNIGFAAFSMNKDLGIGSYAFGIGAGIFFLGYFLFEVPSNLILHRIGARIWIARVMVTWGLISGAMAFAQGERSFYAMRFVLGVAEAGFFPGIILYLTYWFPAGYRASVMALFMAAAPLSTALGSPLSGMLLQMHGLMGLRGWQWMFLIEAFPAVLLGIVTFFYLTDKPEQAGWLAQDERDWLVATMAAERAAAPAPISHNPLKALADIRVIALALVYFGTSAGLYTLGLWSPLMIRAHGLSSLATGFVNAIPSALSIIAMVAWARHSDRTGERVWHVVWPCLLAAAGLAGAAAATNLVMVVIALVVVNIGISCAKAPMWAMPGQFLGGSAAAAGVAAINSIGNLGGFVGPVTIGWLKERSGSFAPGLLLVGASLLLSALLILWLARHQKAMAAAPSTH
jgi:ACS family tartrate transporter-like MFS transporter